MRTKGTAILTALALLVGFAGGAAGSDWDGFKLSRDCKYWRGPREVTPGPYLCTTPAATKVTTACDRWPDASDLRRFAEDAVRLSGAKTEQEKALAVWRWTRRLKVHTDGNAPDEKLAQVRTSYVTDPIKVLNVYGAHFCGGLSRVIELIWRGSGRRSDRVHCWSHSMADLYYKDDDGVTRPHLFDTNFGGFMYHSSRKRVMTTDEFATDYYGGKTSWIHNYHWAYPTHRLDMAFRTGEKLERIWGNWKKPYQSHMDPKRDNRRTPLFERGPYKTRTFGNGLWTYSPDPSKPEWLKGLAEPPVGMVRGKFMPGGARRPATAVWHFRTPYIVSDFEVEMKAVRKNPEDIIRLHLSIDGGKTWKKLWELDKIGKEPMDIKANPCKKFVVTTGKEAEKPAKDFNSPFGRYSFRVKLEMIAKESPQDCRIDALTFKTTVQQNFYALPQLQPGRNKITVRGKLEKGSALKITYVWDDPQGKGRKNVTVLEKTPANYEIIAAGSKWEDCVCKSITIEAVPATGKGNRTELKEAPSPIMKLPPMRHVRDTRGRRGWWRRSDPKRVKPTATIIARIKESLKKIDELEVERKKEGADIEKLRKEHGSACSAISGQLKGLLETRDPKAFEVAKEVVYKARSGHTKNCALVVMVLCGGEKAKPVLVDVLENRQKVAWTEVKVKKGSKNADQHWTYTAVVIGVLAKSRGWSEVVPGLVKVIESGHMGKHVHHPIMRALASIGDKRAAGVIRKAVKRRGYAAYYGALAAAKIGDRSCIGDIRKLLAGRSTVGQEYAALALGKLKDTASIPKLKSMLQVASDENLRYSAADALGDMGDRRQIATLKAALAVEPFPWIQDKMKAAIKKLGGTP